MDDDIARRLAALRHHMENFTIRGQGLQVQGSVKDGFVISGGVAVASDAETTIPPCIYCEQVDLWPEGELPPPIEITEGDPPETFYLHVFNHYCLREFVYDRDQDTGALSNKRVWRITFPPPGDAVFTETTNFYNFDPSWVTGALDALSVPPAGPCEGSIGGQMRVHFRVDFYREFDPFTDHNPPVGGVETSVPRVRNICYSYELDVDDYYENLTDV